MDLKIYDTEVHLNGYQVNWAPGPARLEEIFHLRHKVFCNELQWRESNLVELEFDRYDLSSWLLSVISPDNKLIATTRVTSFSKPWMIHNEFEELLKNCRLFGKIEKTPMHAEVSRLVVDRDYRGLKVAPGISVAMLLYFGICHFCMLKNIRFNYFVCHLSLTRALQQAGISVQAVWGQNYLNSINNTIIAKVDWKDTFENCSSTNFRALISTEPYKSYTAALKLSLLQRL